jgi:hypothetical protein
LLDRLAMIEMIEKDAAAAQATLYRALALAATEDDSKLRADLRHDLAVAALMTGAVAEAEQWLAEPSQASDMPTNYERQLIEALILLVKGDSPTARSIAGAIADQARASGYELFGIVANRVLAATIAPLPVADLGRLLWVVADNLLAK